MRNRCSYNADDVHIFASVPLSAAAPGPGPAGPSGAPEKLAKPTAKPTAKNDHTRQSRPAFPMHTTRRHEPYTLLKSLCQTGQLSPDGSTP